MAAKRMPKQISAKAISGLSADDAKGIRKYVKPTPVNARLLMGMTREQAAKELGTTVYILTGIENGRGEVSLRVARAMEALYRIPMDDMFPRE